MTFSRVWLPLLLLTLLGASLALAEETEKMDVATKKAAVSSQDSKAGFGRRETICGIIVTVRPEEGIVTLAVRRPSEPPSTQILVHEKRWRDEAGNVVRREEEDTISEGPGETDFNFRVVSSTVIKIDGERVPLGDLATSEDKPATVTFVPRRAGNFALAIELD